MPNPTIASRTLAIAMLMLAGIAAAGAGEPQQDAGRALAHSAHSPALDWGPCPGFMPEGCAIAVLHGDPAGANLDVFLRIPAQSDIPRHWHTSAERMILVAGELRVTYDGHATALLQAGHYAYGPARLPHDASCTSPEPCLLFIAFESPLDAVPGGHDGP